MRTLKSVVVLRFMLLIACSLGAVLLSRPALTAELPQAADVHALQLVADPAIRNGKVAAVEGTAGPRGQKLAVADLSVLQPVEVTLFAVDAQDDLRLDLSKFILDAPARSLSTQGTGYATARFRTQGDLQLTLQFRPRANGLDIDGATRTAAMLGSLLETVAPPAQPRRIA